MPLFNTKLCCLNAKSLIGKLINRSDLQTLNSIVRTSTTNWKWLLWRCPKLYTFISSQEIIPKFYIPKEREKHQIILVQFSRWGTFREVYSESPVRRPVGPGFSWGRREGTSISLDDHWLEKAKKLIPEIPFLGPCAAQDVEAERGALEREYCSSLNCNSHFTVQVEKLTNTLSGLALFTVTQR